MHVPSISPAVDSCAALIVKKSRQAHARLSSESQRYIDPEDLMQESLLEAWKADQRFDPDQNVKFSTYLFKGLDLAYSKFNSPLRRSKRVSKGIVEIDAPIREDSSTTLDFPDLGASAEEVYGAVSSILGIFYDAGPQVQRQLLKLACGDWFVHGRKGMRLARQLRYLADVFRASERDFRLLHSNRDVRAQVLDGMSKLTNIDVADARVLECGVCRGKFSLADVQAGRYVSTSLACHKCLSEMKKKNAVETCFGKKRVVNKNGTTLTEGFSETNAACRLHCPDRVACKHYVERGKRMTAAAEAAVAEVEEDLEDVELDDVEVPVVAKAKGVKKAKSAKAKTEKVAKPAKSKKATKADAKKATSKKAAKSAKAEKPVAKEAKTKAAPKAARKAKSTAKILPSSTEGKALIAKNLDENGNDLPFKKNSMLRYIINEAMASGGVEAAKLEKTIKHEGYDLKYMLPVIRSGESGNSSLRPYPSTHTWTFEETKNGRIKITNMKRIACYEKMARIDGR